MNQLARRKFDFEIEFLDTHALVDETFDVDLDPADLFVVESSMLERAQIESSRRVRD